MQASRAWTAPASSRSPPRRGRRRTPRCCRREPGVHSAAMIDVEHVAKSFGARGAVRAVDDASFSAPDGAITGLLGPNGAGKTTLLRVLATLVRPDAGSARIDGLDVVSARDAVARRI